MTHQHARACYWIVGRDNATLCPAVAVDLHNARGDLTRATWTKMLPHGIAEAEAVAKAYAASHGVTEVTHDTDSTDCFAED